MISVIVATYNGAATLPLMLESLCQLQLPLCGCEFIFVDNASSDNSADIILDYAEKLPIVFLEEKRQGKNFAVSCGVAVAKGDLIVFSDDDIIPNPDWLIRYEQAAKEQPHASVFAGQVRHYWMSEPKCWLEQLGLDGAAFAGTPANRPPGPIKAVEIKGPNFMVRQSLIDEFEFNTSIGPNGSNAYVAGSETEYLLRIEQAGYTMQYIPSALVRHIVKPGQMRLSSILKRYYRIGRGMEATGVVAFSGNFRTLFGYPRFISTKTARQLTTSLYFAMTGNRYRSVRVLMQIAVQLGRAMQWKSSRQGGVA